MAITIVETVSSATANSYQTLAAAQAIIDGLVEDDDVVAWSSATTDQKNRALVTATKRQKNSNELQKVLQNTEFEGVY